MKICRYIHDSSLFPKPRLGILLEDETIVDPNFCFALDYQREGYYNPFERADHTMPTDLSSLLKKIDAPLERLEMGYSLFLFFKKLGLNELQEGIPISFPLRTKGPSLKAPLDKIGTYRDFYTHEKHVKAFFERRGEKMPKAWYEIPVYYKGATAGFIGPEEKIPWPSYTEKLDYELELAVVIGRDGKNIKEEEAPTHIFGYTILNDISARDIQKKEMSVRLGPSKGKDFCSVIGPVITTMDEFDFQEPDLAMTARVNGKVWSRGRSSEGHFNFSQMIAYASREEWLLAGDLLGSGTVGTGSGAELDQWIRPSDMIELEIERIGCLKNQVGRKEKKGRGRKF